ncbi:hypothetical protein Tco_1114018 [Tanacetum coccineum]|uniref:Protein kinase-like domain, concanavalin A-like lectin/glucanase domain protein n=1 Tax=Tanacetum coccineum TaxID=301880 RepID=A0ABQ5IVB7_9ASTR
MHVFIGNFTYFIDFMIVEDIGSIIDPRLSQVVLGKPFVEISNMTHDPPKGVVRFTNGTNEIAYKMPHKIEQYNSLLDLEKEHTKSVYLRNEEDKIRGVEYVMSKIFEFYKECLELGPEYLTGVADEEEVTGFGIARIIWQTKDIYSGTMVGVEINTLTMEINTCNVREKPEIRGNVNFEIKSQFMRELKEGPFSGNKNEDAHDHLDRVFNIVSLFNIPRVSQDAVLLRPHLDKECPLNEEVKQVDEVKYGEFGRPTPFNGSIGARFRVGPPGYYTCTRYSETYSGEKKPNLVETINKYMEEATKRQAEQDEWLKTFCQNTENSRIDHDKII